MAINNNWYLNTFQDITHSLKLDIILKHILVQR